MPDLTAINAASRDRIAATLLSIQRTSRVLVELTSQAAYSVRHNAPDAAAMLERVIEEHERIGEEVEKLRHNT